LCGVEVGCVGVCVCVVLFFGGYWGLSGGLGVLLFWWGW